MHKVNVIWRSKKVEFSAGKNIQTHLNSDNSQPPDENTHTLIHCRPLDYLSHNSFVTFYLFTIRKTSKQIKKVKSKLAGNYPHTSTQSQRLSEMEPPPTPRSRSPQCIQTMKLDDFLQNSLVFCSDPFLHAFFWSFFCIYHQSSFSRDSVRKQAFSRDSVRKQVSICIVNYLVSLH